MTNTQNSNVIQLHEGSYKQHITSVALDVHQRKLRGEKVNPLEIIYSHVITSEDNSPLERVFVETELMTKTEFKRALNKKKRDDQINTDLGFLPGNANEYVAGIAKKYNIAVLLNGELKREWVVKLGDREITENDLSDNEVAAYYAIASNRSYNTEKFKLDLRILRDNLKLDYRDSQIADAVSGWYDQSRETRRCDIFTLISYTKGKATGPVGQEMWAKMERAAFDVSKTKPGFAIAIIKKFMWQVKRKGRNAPVTNHLMPVLTGKQGGGKSTLVTSMLAPLADAVKTATFSDIADNRLIDMWETPVLFMDEMSGARKADMNTVKQAITASSLTRRPMRTNTDIQVAQRSTFIGCSNDGLGEIIKDNTGIRRFAELDFAQQPDWKAMNEIDWLLLWRSVDENGEDPSLLVLDVLKEQQEENRNTCQVETWVCEERPSYPTWVRASVVYEDFSAWEKDNFPGYNTSITVFGRRFANLIKQRGDSFGWEHRYRSGFSEMKTN